MSTLATDLRRAPAAKPYAASDSSGGLPTRTDIEGWIEEIDVLSSSAAAYCAAANRIETGADTYVQAMSAPGGTAWEGDAADAAREASYADRGVVYRAADHMRNMAQLVNLGAQHLSQARDRVLDAIADAEGDAFKVGDALTVTDMRRYTTGETDVYLARKSRAEEHRAYIAMRAGVLASEDAEIGAKLKAGAAELEGMIPLSWRTSDDNRSDTIQMVDHEFAPGNEETGSGGASPSADDIRSVLEQLPEGSRRWIREVRSPEDLQALWTWMGQGGVENPARYGDPTKGIWKDLPDGSGIGQRFASKSTQGPSLDISLDSGEHWKIHINPEAGGAVPDALVEGPAGSTDQPDSAWGTPISPEELRRSGGELGILQDFVDAVRPPDPSDPRNMA